MPLAFELVTETPGWGDEARWQALFSPLAASVAACLPISPDLEFSVLLADDALVRSLNKDWRSKDEPTNVLSFPAPDTARQHGMLGDIALSFDTLQREAKAQGKTLDAHAAHLFLHGLLHLLGHDHQNEAEAEAMEGLERKILLELGHPDPYEERVQGSTISES